MDVLNNVLNKFSDKLLSLASDKIISQLFSGLTGGSGSGLIGSIAGLFGSGSSAASAGSVAGAQNYPAAGLT